MANNHNQNIDARFRLAFRGSRDRGFTLDVDITMPGRGITAVFGQSGSGKSTLLRCVAGLEKADQGRLIVKGETWQSTATFLPTHRRPLGYVFQEASLFAHLSVMGNLKYAIKRADAAVSAEFIERVIGVMGISALLQRRPHQLSGGERQRVAIARALLIQPRLLLMDEPLASLDAARKQEIMPYLERLHASFDIPVLYVSHALDEVARLADHAVVLEQGKVIAQGGLTEVFSRTDLPLGAGEEPGVVLSARVAERDSQWHLTRVAFDGGELWVRDSGDAQGQSVRIRVLARDISLAMTCHEDSSILNRLPVRVTEVSGDQDESMALVRLRVGASYLVARVTRKSVHQLRLEPGKAVWAQIKSVAIVR